MFGVIEVARVSRYGVIISFSRELNLVINSEISRERIVNCPEYFNNFFNNEVKAIFTRNFLQFYKKSEELNDLIRSWSEIGIVFIPNKDILRNLIDIESSALNVLEVDYDDILPLSEDTDIVYISKLGDTTQHDGSLDKRDYVLINYKNVGILYVYTIEPKEKFVKVNYDINKEIPNIDLVIMCLVTNQEGFKSLSSLENLPYFLGVETEYLVLLDNIINLRGEERIISLGICEKVSFTRHFTKIHKIRGR